MTNLTNKYPGASSAVDLAERLDQVRLSDFPPVLQQALRADGCEDGSFFQHMVELGVSPDQVITVLRVFFSQPGCETALVQMDHPDFRRYIAVKMGLV